MKNQSIRRKGSLLLVLDGIALAGRAQEISIPGLNCTLNSNPHSR